MTSRQDNIPNQAQTPNSVQGEYAAHEERERITLRKGRSLPTMGRTKRREKQMADLFSTSSSQDAPNSAPSSTKSRQTKKSKTPSITNKMPSTKPCLTDPSTPIRWAGGAFENSPPPSSLPLPVFSDDEGNDNEDDDLLCGSTSSSDGEHYEPSLTAAPLVEAKHGAAESRSPVHSANPNQFSPPPAENQPRSIQTRSRSKSTPKDARRSIPSTPASTSAHLLQHEQQQQQRSPHHSPILPRHPVFMLSPHPAAKPAGFYYYPSSSSPVAPAAVVQTVLPPSQPQPSRDLDQLSSELRKMLGISVST
jgi:hypothetical protein